MSKVPKTRKQPVPTEGCFVVRGREDDPCRAAQAARRFIERYPGWAQYGLSGFIVASAEELDAVCERKVSMWDVIVVFRVEDLIRADLAIRPTFRTPHVTVLHRDLKTLIDGLTTVPHKTVMNRYHGLRGGRQ